MLKLVLEVVLGVGSCLNGKDTTHRECSIPRKSAKQELTAGMLTPFHETVIIDMD